MAKIKIFSLLLIIVIFILMANLAYAAGSKLIFSDVDVRVGGRSSNNLNNGATIGEQAQPGDSVEFLVKVQNNFTNAENLRIRDITVKTTIETIDDGNDLEDESSSFELSPGSEKRITLKFKVPLEVDEDTFNVIIHTEGEDKNGSNHESDMNLQLEVDKKSHMLKITRALLSPIEVACNRKNIQLGTTLINIGNEDEKDATFEVANPTLGINFKDAIDELTAEPHADASRFSKTYTFKVPDDVESGSYPITLKAFYDDNRKKAEQTVTLTVNDCGTARQQRNATQEVVTNTQTSETSTATTGTNELPPDTVSTQESFFKSNAFIAGIIVVELIAVIVGIALVINLFRKA